MCSRSVKGTVSLAACQSGADVPGRPSTPGPVLRRVERPALSKVEGLALSKVEGLALSRVKGRPRLVSGLVLALLAVPSTAVAQRDAFFSALVTFQRSLAGLYGDEGPQLAAQLESMSTALDRWDGEIREAEPQLRSRLPAADAQTTLQIHALLASLYLERGRYADAVREFDEDLSIDPRRAPFHRFRGLALQAMSRSAEAADAFRATWLLDPADPQNAYR